MMEFTKETVDALEKEYGLPLYVFDEQGFADNYRRLESAMRSRYDNYRVAYSYKTNYTPYICRTAMELGAYAEVVSGLEYSIAKKLGYADDRIIFNGPDKGEEGREAFLAGCLVNADNLDELAAFRSAAASEPDRRFRIGLRVNLDVGQGFVSRFGIDETELPEAFRMAEETANLRIAGLHCHISRCRGLSAWEARTAKMLSLAERFFPEGPEFIDLGSGMFGSMAPEFAAQFSDVPTYEDYARVTAEPFARRYGREKGPILFTEPGTTLVNRFVSCVARVDAVKCVRGKWFAVLNCSLHDLGETASLKRLPVSVVPGGAPQTDHEDVTFTGYTCLEQDVMYTGFRGALAVGDRVVFGNVGGYSNVLKPPFIRPGCAMAAAAADGGFRLVKAAETYEDLLRAYRF